jgi:hypothetical protein
MRQLGRFASLVRYSRDAPLSGSCPSDARNDPAGAGGGDVVAPGAFDDGDVVLLAFVDGGAPVEVTDGCDAEVEEIDVAGGVVDAFGITGGVGGGGKRPCGWINHNPQLPSWQVFSLKHELTF